MQIKAFGLNREARSQETRQIKIDTYEWTTDEISVENAKVLSDFYISNEGHLKEAAVGVYLQFSGSTPLRL